MGVINSGILGGFSGKVGPVVGGSWKGIAYMRQLPASVANPQTAAQTAQRTKLSNCVAFAKAILTTIIKPLNDRFAQGESGYNSFVSRNISLFAAAAPSPAADLRVSEGSLLGVTTAQAGGTGGSADVFLNWIDNSGTGNAQATDGAYIVAYNETQGTFGVSSAAVQRDNPGPTITMPTVNDSGDVFHFWISMRSANGFSVSDSVYALGDIA
jgi:hypothetical protein